ncbi:hypothetical protein HSX11_05630 [Oxalobacteraceae bacterium]|nr:hypothetical protein [Oxalobacteraceae bacterium]
MEQTIIVILGVLGLCISVVVKLIFMCMGAETEAREAAQAAPRAPSSHPSSTVSALISRPRQSEPRRRHAGAQRYPRSRN